MGKYNVQKMFFGHQNYAPLMITEVTTMREAWTLLDLHYGDLQEVRAKLKEKVQGLKLKIISALEKIVECFIKFNISLLKSRHLVASPC